MLSSLVAEAALVVMPKNPKNFNVDNVRVVKIMGGSLAGSKVVQGMVFGREPEGDSTQTLDTVRAYLHLTQRYRQKGIKCQSGRLHLCARRRPNRDKRHSPHQKRRRNAQLHPGRGKTP